MDMLTNILGAAAAATILLTLAAKFLPNEKVYMWGYELGRSLTTFGTDKAGYAWEKIEDFLTNSVGIFFNGVRDGLNSDDDPEKIIKPTPPNDILNKDKVRK